MTPRVAAHTRRGFTISEVMVALVLLTIAVLGLVAAQAFAVRSTEGNRPRHLASEIAASRMASIESRLRRDFGSVDAPRAPVAGRPGCECETIGTDVSPGLKRVEVRVYYRDVAGEQAYTLWSYFHLEAF